MRLQVCIKGFLLPSRSNSAARSQWEDEPLQEGIMMNRGITKSS